MPPTEIEIPAWEQEILSVFVSLFETFGLPRSTALLYGTLYCAEAPMLQDEICRRLRISAGSASQGLRHLQSIGAVHREIPLGSRQSIYTAELSLRRVLGHLLDSQLRPKLQNSRDKLQTLTGQIPADTPHARLRIQTLQAWQGKAEKAIPLLRTLLGTPQE